MMPPRDDLARARRRLFPEYEGHPYAPAAWTEADPLRGLAAGQRELVVQQARVYGGDVAPVLEGGQGAGFFEVPAAGSALAAVASPGRLAAGAGVLLAVGAVLWFMRRSGR